jgi:hypothetical protein
MEKSTELYNTFDKSNHLLPAFNKSTFDTIHSWDFGWAILEPLNIAPDLETEKELAKRLSPGQKALYFFWYLDAQVTNGGFIQFFWNGYSQYIPPILEGLKLIGDSNLKELVDEANQEYLTNIDKFNSQRNMGDSEVLYDELKEFDKMDDKYYEIHDRTMELFEKYVRANPNEFVILS